MVFCISMKTPFSSVVTPQSPCPLKQCCKTLPICLFVSNIEKGGRGGYLSRGERERRTYTKEKGLLIFMYLVKFCPWLKVQLRSPLHDTRRISDVFKNLTGHVQTELSNTFALFTRILNNITSGTQRTSCLDRCNFSFSLFESSTVKRVFAIIIAELR